MQKSNVMVKRITRILAVGLMVAFLGGCGLLPKEEEVLAPPLVKPKKQEYELYTVKKGNIEKTLKGMATFTPGEQKSLFYKEAGPRLASLNVKEGDMVEKGAVLAELDTGDLASRIKQSELSLKNAKLDLESAKRNLANAKKGTFNEETQQTVVNQDAVYAANVGVQKAQIAVDSQNLSLKDLKNSSSKSKLVAPISGKVVFVADVKEGDNIEPFKTLIQIADPSQLQLTYEITDSAKLNLVKVGMAADISYGGQKYQGEVVSAPSSLPVDASPNLKNAIVMSVKNLPNDLKMGDMVDFIISLEKKENAIIVPMRGIRTYVGHDYVEVLENGSKKELDIETGIKTATEAEVISGLKEGQQVILK